MTAQLLSVEEGSTRWAGRFDEEFTDVLRLEDSISEQVARALLPHLTGDEREQLARRGTDNAEAYEAFLRGRYHWYTMSEEGFAKSVSCYQRAISLDPKYAEAYAGLAEYHAWLAVYGLAEPARELRVARESAQKAINLDENLAAAHTSHGLSLLTHEWQWRLAGARFRRAIELSPNYTQAHAHYACQLAMEGRFDESVAEARPRVRDRPAQPLQLLLPLVVSVPVAPLRGERRGGAPTTAHRAALRLGALRPQLADAARRRARGIGRRSEARD